MAKQITLETPLGEADVRRLKIGDCVVLTGTVFTARDQVHKYLFEKKPKEFKELLKGGIIYHCGPIVKDNKIVSAGPTTSIREEPYMADLLKRYKIRVVIGKGGMGEDTLRALKDVGAVYLAATGGAGALLADSMEEVKSVRFKEFGMPDAMWELKVRSLPAIVAMDSHGNSMYDNVLNASRCQIGMFLSNHS